MVKNVKLKIKPEWLKIAYLLLGDALLLSALAFCFVLIAEGLAPGIITGHLSFVEMIGGMALLWIGILSLEKYGQFSFPAIDPKKQKVPWKNPALIVLGILTLLLVINSLLRFPPVAMVIIILGIIGIAIILATPFFRES